MWLYSHTINHAIQVFLKVSFLGFVDAQVMCIFHSCQLLSKLAFDMTDEFWRLRLFWRNIVALFDPLSTPVFSIAFLACNVASLLIIIAPYYCRDCQLSFKKDKVLSL